MELDYYHQRVNVLVVSRVSEQQKLANIKKIPEMLGHDSRPPIRQILTFALKYREKSAIKNIP